MHARLQNIYTADHLSFFLKSWTHVQNSVILTDVNNTKQQVVGRCQFYLNEISSGAKKVVIYSRKQLFYRNVSHSDFTVNTCVAAACRQPVDVVLAVDTSTSVGRLNMVRVLEYCQSLVVGLDARSRFALVTFSDRPRFVLNFTDHLSYRTLDSLSAAYTAAPSTDTAGALRFVCELLTSASIHQRRVGVLIVDGR